MPDEQYGILKWNQNESMRGWPRYEIRPMNGLNEHSPDYTIMFRGLEFDIACLKLKRLEKADYNKKQ
jgi:hypothetical protein